MWSVEWLMGALVDKVDFNSPSREGTDAMCCTWPEEMFLQSSQALSNLAPLELCLACTLLLLTLKPVRIVERIEDER